ncbi:MAG: hypothetical protein EBZ77_13155, partial [Chitinophagia bacterium]|nr:hypothetical protein [Chitinophagia bacterium]
MLHKAALAICLSLLLVTLFSCRKEQLLTTGGSVAFSTDTLKFDTVFTSVGSYTSGCLIYNTQNQPIRLSSVRMKGGAKSFFHLNVDGFEGQGQDVKIAAHDSIYVFATVKIDPTDE